MLPPDLHHAVFVSLPTADVNTSCTTVDSGSIPNNPTKLVPNAHSHTCHCRVSLKHLTCPMMQINAAIRTVLLFPPMLGPVTTRHSPLLPHESSQRTHKSSRDTQGIRLSLTLVNMLVVQGLSFLVVAQVFTEFFFSTPWSYLEFNGARSSPLQALLPERFDTNTCPGICTAVAPDRRTTHFLLPTNLERDRASRWQENIFLTAVKQRA